MDLLRTGLLNIVSGSNRNGKTPLTCGIVSMLHKLGYTVIAVDVSGAWKHNLKGLL